jgi:hypothetical protein
MSPPWSRFARTKEAHPGYAGPGIDRLVLQISLDVGNTRKLHGGLFIAVVEPMIFREPSCQLVAEYVPAERIAVNQELAALTELRDKPAGSIRISATDYAARMILMPASAKVLPKYPDIKVEVAIDYGLADIIATQFDAGIRLVPASGFRDSTLLAGAMTR